MVDYTRADIYHSDSITVAITVADAVMAAGCWLLVNVCAS